jgi:drug/metabolite transporter (DMT)-like permease
VLNINETGDAVVTIAIALVGGALGGLVSELLLERGKSQTTGVLMLPDRTGRSLELGSLAAVLIGLVAGVVAAVLLVPINDVVVNNVTERQIDWFRVLGVAIVAGAAGQAFWAAMTKGLTASDYNARIESALAMLKQQKQTAPDDEKGGAAAAGLDGAIAALEKALADAP